MLLVLVLLVAGGCSFAPVPMCHAQEPPPPPPLPSAPAEVTVSGIQDTSAFVSWSPAAGATTYTVWVDGRRFTGTTGNGAELRGLTPYTLYTVYVTAANDAGESGPSSSVSFTTLPPPPGQPDKPEVVSVTDNKAVVHFQPLPPWQHILSYRLYVDGKAVTDVSPQEGTQAAQLVNLQPGTHTVAVSGINENREGPLSPPATFTIQSVAPPAGLRLVNRAPDAVWIAWDQVPGAARYLVYRGDLADPVAVTSETAYKLAGLTPETAYTVGVVAELPDGNRSAPAQLEVKTLAAPETAAPGELVATAGAYLNDALPGMLVLFGAGAAFIIARAARTPFARFLFTRWLR